LLKQQGHNIHVAVTGDIHDYRNPFFKNKIFQLISSENVRENIIFLGLIDRMDQKQLLVNSISIVQPSRFEGWNTLVEEAKCLDKRILLSDIPVHLEQKPPKAVYFRDNDHGDLADKLLSLYNEPLPAAETTGITMSDRYKDNITKFAAHFINTSLFDHSEPVPGAKS
jgi:glycosyltransferase involved in cell wall biosynthesis